MHSTFSATATKPHITEHLCLVHKVAKKIACRLPHTVSVDDLIGAGTLGLLDAINRFDPHRCDRFPPYAEIRIRGAILDELRAMDWLPRTQRARVRRNADGQAGPAPSLEAVLLVDDVHDDGFDGFALEHPTPANPLESRERARALSAAIEALPQREQQVLGLYYIEDLTFKEIGAILGVSESRVCQLHGQAMKRLRQQLGDDVVL